MKNEKSAIALETTPPRSHLGDMEEGSRMSGITHWAKSLWERSMLHRAVLVAPPVAVGLLASYWTIGNRQALQYYTAKAEKGDIAQAVQATGTINAVTTVQVGSQVSGNIAQILADFNSHVKKGQVV